MSNESESVVDRLMRRMQALEEEKQWWKRAALCGFALFLLAFISGAVVTVGCGVMYWSTVERQDEHIRMMDEMRARDAQQQVEQARQEAEAARLRAVRDAVVALNQALNDAQEARLRAAEAQAELAAEIARQRLKEQERQNK